LTPPALRFKQLIDFLSELDAFPNSIHTIALGRKEGVSWMNWINPFGGLADFYCDFGCQARLWMIANQRRPTQTGFAELGPLSDARSSALTAVETFEYKPAAFL